MNSCCAQSAWFVIKAKTRCSEVARMRHTELNGSLISPFSSYLQSRHHFDLWNTSPLLIISFYHIQSSPRSSTNFFFFFSFPCGLNLLSAQAFSYIYCFLEKVITQNGALSSRQIQSAIYSSACACRIWVLSLSRKTRKFWGNLCSGHCA